MAEQRWDPAAYAHSAAFVPRLGRAVLDLLAVQPGERVLDLGCGDGVLTEELVARGADVVGIDSSPEMVEAARGRGIDARVGRATALGFSGEFDAVFSNAVLHWVPEAAAVADGVRNALRPGGRFVGEFGGHGNTAGICIAVQSALRLRGIEPGPNPWYYPTAAEYAGVLEAAGFEVVSCELVPRPTPLPDGLASWLQVFGEPLLRPAPEELRAALIEEAVAIAAPSLRDHGGNWTADYIRLRFAARLPV
jgi:SAM-dependent methyltransferase